MLKQSIFAATALSALAMAAPANAETYVGVGVTNSTTDVEGFNLGSGQTYDLALGQDLVFGLRGEARVGSYANESNLFGLPLNVNATRLSGDLFWDFNNPTALTPYVGLGGTYTDGTVDVVFTEADVSGFGWQASAGVRAPLTERVELDARYTLGRSSLDVDFGPDMDLEEQAVRLGVNWKL